VGALEEGETTSASGSTDEGTLVRSVSLLLCVALEV
jgi:hypothetical protein